MVGDDPLSESLAAVYDLDTDPELVLRALATPRCRYVLALLQANDGTMSIDDAAAHVAGWEFHCDPGEVSKQTTERLATAIYHVQGPKLAKAGLLDVDRDEFTIALSEAGSQLGGQPFLPTVK